MPDALRRAIRTFIQSFVGTLLSSGLASAVDTNGIVDWSSLKKVTISAVAAAVVALLTYIQNALEDNTNLPTVVGK